MKEPVEAHPSRSPVGFIRVVAPLFLDWLRSLFVIPVVVMSRQPHPNALPAYERAEIPREKLETYSLNPEHVSSVSGKSSGKDKARVFKTALGFEKADWEELKRQIFDELPFHEAQIGFLDEFGQRYNVTVPVVGKESKTALVLTAWIIAAGFTYPTLITAYVIRGRV